MFGKAFDGNVIKRIWALCPAVSARRRALGLRVVLTFTLMQLMIPLIIRYATDHGMQQDGSHSALTWAVVGFPRRDRHQLRASYAMTSSAAWPKTCSSTFAGRCSPSAARLAFLHGRTTSAA